MTITKIKAKGYFVHVNPPEAQELIQSLITQIVGKNSNANRLESYTSEGEYFTIAVEEPQTLKRR